MLHTIMEYLKSLEARDEQGQGLLEYALIILLIVIVVIVALSPLGAQIANIFTTITGNLGG